MFGHDIDNFAYCHDANKEIIQNITCHITYVERLQNADLYVSYDLFIYLFIYNDIVQNDFIFWVCKNAEISAQLHLMQFLHDINIITIFETLFKFLIFLFDNATVINI